MDARHAIPAAAALVASCSKSLPPAPAEVDPAATSPISGTSATAPPNGEGELLGDTPPVAASDTRAPVAANVPLAAQEARRRSLLRLEDDRQLQRHESILRRHFRDTLPSPLEVQTAALPGDRRAFLTYGEPRRREPLLLVTSAQGDLLWTKERPLAGTRQIVTEMALAPGPHGEVSLVWCDIPTQIVGLRKWAADGVVLADFAVLEVDVCEALAAIYWPGRGWIAVASQHGAARAQLLDERGTRAWGPKGIDLPWAARPSSPASVAIDSDTSAIVFQVGDAPRGGGVVPDHVLAMRYDALGAKLWDGPIDLGPAPVGPAAGEVGQRIGTTLVGPGRVRVAFGARVASTVTSVGAILGAR